jgi:hypothetical protein
MLSYATVSLSRIGSEAFLFGTLGHFALEENSFIADETYMLLSSSQNRREKFFLILVKVLGYKQ